MQIANVASDIAPHVKCLIVNTSDTQKRRKHLECMRNKQFKKINSVEFNGTIIRSHFIM